SDSEGSNSELLILKVLTLKEV
ncbi:hypothetical protein A2U01_0085189, partial [Trifolium medium]|nr:hypothetical protein [Trifolium medium]